MMTKLYLIMLLCIIVVGAFFYGKNVGVSKCEIQNLQNQVSTTEKKQVNERILNDKVFKTGVDDIRRILRDKYTIAE